MADHITAPAGLSAHFKDSDGKYGHVPIVGFHAGESMVLATHGEVIYLRDYIGNRNLTFVGIMSELAELTDTLGSGLQSIFEAVTAR